MAKSPPATSGRWVVENSMTDKEISFGRMKQPPLPAANLGADQAKLVAIQSIAFSLYRIAEALDRAHPLSEPWKEPKA